MGYNVGHGDRLFRMMLGVALVLGGLTSGGFWGWTTALVGVVIIITGMAGNCFIYSLFDISTYCPPRNKS
ncbi:YgaP family membrane protein [Nitrospina sp. 32_T5]|uniref:YgaP family membrane protein n=1 Tax=unclassified Nitrospina TaxID=2638683 RepID=UPI003F97CE22